MRRAGFPDRIVRLLVALACGCTAAGAAHAQSRLYLAEYAYNDPKLKTMLLDGSALQELTPPPPGDWLLVGLDYDPSAAHLYWSHGSYPGLIRRADSGGSGQQLLVSGLKYPRGIALDTQHGWMYWAEAPPQGNAMGLIRRARLDGSGLMTVYALTPYDPIGSYVGTPAVDPVNGYVYFGAANEIRRIQLDGSGPAQTVVRGLNTPIALALDVAQDRIWFLDANTNTDLLGCARLDDTDFGVVFDGSPGIFGSSGLVDLELDRADGRLYFTDELQKTIRRCRTDGSELEIVYAGPPSHSPTGLALDADPAQPIQDCNGNSIRDLDDIEGGSSADCNTNGIPDECETDPCIPIDWDLDQGSDPGPTGRTLSGDPASGFEVFQPFDIVTLPGVPGVNVVRIGLDGWTVDYAPAGFSATIFPDDGAGMPDESQPLGSADLQYRFSPTTVVWVYADLAAFLPAGRFHVRLTASAPAYEASVNLGLSGLPSFSRRLSNGQIVPSTYPIALRLLFAEPESVPDAGDEPGPSQEASLSPGLSIAAPHPNPSSERVTIGWSRPHAGRVTAEILDPAGRRVRLLFSGEREPGAAEVEWDGRDAAGRRCWSGIYFARVSATREDGSAESLTRRLVRIR
jgi:hypothetical protein